VQAFRPAPKTGEIVYAEPLTIFDPLRYNHDEEREGGEMNSSNLLSRVWTGIRSRSREIALIIVLLLINYLIFSRLGIMILSSQQPTPTATRTPKPTFTPAGLVVATPTPTLGPEPTPTIEATAAPVSSPSPPPSPSPITHVVQAGETLSEIARMYDTTLEAIVQANDLADANAISVGQVLLIPSSAPETPTEEATTEPIPTPSSPVGQRIHVVEPGETLSEIARMYGATVDEIVQANGLDNPNDISVGQALVIP
jgi:LysM repeat protein